VEFKQRNETSYIKEESISIHYNKVKFLPFKTCSSKYQGLIYPSREEHNYD